MRLIVLTEDNTFVTTDFLGAVRAGEDDVYQTR